MKRSLITGTGYYIPTVIQKNSDFIDQLFYAEDGTPIKIEPSIVIDKFKKITGIEERRYAPAHMKTSDMAALAAEKALEESGINAETLGLLIVAHNFGDVAKSSIQSDTVPSLASRVKQQLGIKNPSCIAFDVLFGCPGWVLGLMQADAFFKAGMAEKALVIGAESLSRVIDAYDRDSMIFSDGAGAVVLEYKETANQGILSSSALSHCSEEVTYLTMDASYNPQVNSGVKYMKMKGRKVYEYALKYVPEAMKACFDKTGLSVTELKMIFIHQANEKMDEAIVQAFYKLYGYHQVPQGVMPMCIHWLGNSSVATIPTLYDLVLKGQIDEHHLQPGNVVLFASVGAGMNINAVTYRL
ncbi:MAG: ketoacyl-ACP synthase III [Bacteroidota bacterium]|nr:ketoacyl-ACP synthase III [Flavisolibacter sp.]MDQ3846122.1 ketoacyl-ACP synthase III [Bacteroidota bacterium]